MDDVGPAVAGGRLQLQVLEAVKHQPVLLLLVGAVKVVPEAAHFEAIRIGVVRRRRVH